MNLTTQEYEKLNQKASRNTKSYFTLPMAFLIGGLICTLGQALLNLYTYLGFNEKDAGMLVSASLIFLTALLPASAFLMSLPNTRGPVHLSQLPDLPMPWYHRRLNLKAKVLSWV